MIGVGENKPSLHPRFFVISAKARVVFDKIEWF